MPLAWRVRAPWLAAFAAGGSTCSTPVFAWTWIPKTSDVTVSKRRGAAVFGTADGLTMVLGLIAGLAVALQPSAAVWHASLAGGIAELGGMSLGQYWGDPDKDKVAAALNGGACCAASILAGLPFLLLSRGLAITVSLIITGLIACLVTLAREETGLMAAVRTFGLLIVAGGLAGLSGLS